jgi:hypothetical protein
VKYRSLLSADALKSRAVMAGVFVLASMLAGVFTAGLAIAQAVRAVLVANVDDPGRIPYQVDTACVMNSIQYICENALPLVPAGKRLVITHVSGFVDTDVPGGTLLRAAVRHISGFPSSVLPTSFQGVAGGKSRYVFNAPVLAFFSAGEYPVTSVAVAGAHTGASSEFTLTGYLVDCSSGPCAAIAP